MLYFLPNRGICIYTISVVITLITNNIKTGQARIRLVWDERDYSLVWDERDYKKFELYANCLIVMIASLLISHGSYYCFLDGEDICNILCIHYSFQVSKLLCAKSIGGNKGS